MTIQVQVLVEDVNTKLDTYDTIRLYRASSAEGSYSLVDTETLVADEAYYTLSDASGTLASWYKYQFFHSVSLATSVYSNPLPPQAVSRKQIRQGLLKAHRAGRVFSAVTGGATTAIVPTNDYYIKSPVFSAGRGKNAYLRKSGGANSPEDRIISASSPTAGTFTVSPVLSSSPITGDEFEWHWLVAPEEIDLAINRGLTRYLFEERVPVVGVADATEYSLANMPWLTQKKQVTGLFWTPDGSVTERPWIGGGRWWNLRQDRGALTLQLPYLQAGVEASLYTLRTADPLYTEDSVIPDGLDFDLVVAFAYDEVLTYLVGGGWSGTNMDRGAWTAARKVLREGALASLIEKNAPRPKYSLPMTNTPSSMPRPYTSR